MVGGSVLLGPGATGLTVGTWSGVHAVSLAGDDKAYCGKAPYDDVCGQKRLALRDQARTYAGWSTGAERKQA